jgi:hypothetical protein
MASFGIRIENHVAPITLDSGGMNTWQSSTGGGEER